jgi:hypothetical protein
MVMELYGVELAIVSELFHGYANRISHGDA